MEELIDRYGEARLMLAAGGGVGLLFGMAAAHSRFCLRAATVELADGHPGPRLAIWLLAFFSALALVQGAILAGWLDVSSARQLATTGSLSGAILGGLMFGCGMILARGCASRLLVLSASGNLRAIVTGLVLTLVAQAALRGVLSPARHALATLWTIDGGQARRFIGPEAPLFPAFVALVGLCLLAALAFAARVKLPRAEAVSALCVGGAVFLGWGLTYQIAQASFEVVGLQSVTFTGPSADTLMALINTPNLPMSFGLGLVPGVFLGALIVAALRGEVRIQRFEPDTPMERYLIGGALMGFGSMLAGGCAVGAGMSGGAILAVTAWVAVFCMWIGAMLTHRALRAWGTPKPA
ncbi:YeeE/YedE family protein [Pseudoruegeria sp. SHC-113]|uniref:YeeE/YedE family protein n=1 Tax=Pseudoruegeria sp. SHC-113 TaxID=2855439 RepID=UPI0021BA4284|nr:YeeE/YedE family protein [Pseudoruegeria sp. SHC-113]MCT8162183.1 YeeE/YedE family protein [Pseudoruegeria sp. SHC-113]